MSNWQVPNFWVTFCKSHFFLTVFLAEDTGGDPVAMDDARQVGWFTPEEIRGLPVPQSMVDCMDMLEGKRPAV